MSLLTCAAALLEVEESSRAAVTFGSADARLTATLTGLVAVEGLGAERITVTWDTLPTCADAVGLRLETHNYRQGGGGRQ